MPTSERNTQLRPGRGRHLLRALTTTALAVVVTGTVVVASVIGVSTPAPASAATTATKAADLSGVTVNFADIFKGYQTIVNATNTLEGAPYKVSWSEFTSGPPIVAAETGGSVDLGVMAETPVIFAQAAGDPIKVVAALQGTAKVSPYSILVQPGSSIKKLSQLRGKTIAVQEGTVEQYALIQALESAGVPYSAVTINNLTVTAGEAALESGKVDAYVGTQPLTGLILHSGKGKVLTDTIPGSKFLEYLTASQSALNDPKKSAAIADFIVRLSKSEAILRQNPTLAAQTYVKTYGVPLSVATQAVKSAKSEGVPLSPSLIKYTQQEANTFLKLGLIPKKLNVAKSFDVSLNKKIVAAAKQSPSS